jgi:hypothetical protein
VNGILSDTDEETSKRLMAVRSGRRSGRASATILRKEVEVEGRPSGLDEKEGERKREKTEEGEEGAEEVCEGDEGCDERVRETEVCTKKRMGWQCGGYRQERQWERTARAGTKPRRVSITYSKLVLNWVWGLTDYFDINIDHVTRSEEGHVCRVW